MNTAEAPTVPVTADTNAQRVLAALLRAPAKPLIVLAREVLPELPEPDLQAVLFTARQTVHALKDIKSKRQHPPGSEVESLLDRLCACWTLLLRAEKAIKSRGLNLHPPLSGDDSLCAMRALTLRTVLASIAD